MALANEENMFDDPRDVMISPFSGGLTRLWP